MESLVTALLIVAESLIVLLGGVISYLAVRAFRRTGSSALRSFAVGVGLITFGGILGGGLDHLLGVGLRRALVIQNLLMVLGLAALIKSIYVDSHLGLG